MSLLTALLACATPETPLDQVIDRPGMQLTLPSWEIQTDAHSDRGGQIKLVDPDASDRFIAVLWVPQQPLTMEQWKQSLATSGGTLEDAELGDVAGVSAQSMRIRIGDKLLLSTLWDCPGPHGVQASVSSFLARSEEAAEALHRRVLDTVQCTERPAPQPPALPKLELPGWDLVSSDPSLVHARGDEVLAYVELTGLPQGIGAMTPDQRGQALTAAMPGAQFRLNMDPDPEPSEGGRTVWTAHGTDLAGPVSVLITELHCPGRAFPFLGIHTRPPELPRPPAEAALLSATCPDEG